jgi:hypothetical protein
MPRINRFRIVNFRFDDDKKYIADELFEFDGENTLLNLENGGGKTVILQLALQVLKPNTQLGSRRFADYFKLDSGTVHIMTEWIRDGITTEYLLTGVCFAKGTDGLRYFTYTHSYTSPNKYDIKNIPVVDDKKQVAGFSEFSKFLRELSSSSRHRINIYSRDRQKDYRQKLETYNLFEDEFDAIRIINQTEGGIEKFFANAKKSRHVVEKLIIPSMPPMDGDEEGILAKTFKKHMENLKSIPVYQHRIKVYDSFLEKFKELLHDVQSYTKKVEENFAYYRNLCILENMLIILIKRLDGDIAKAEEDIEKAKSQIQEAKYRRDSLEYWKVMEQIQLTEDELEKLNINLESKADEKNKLDYDIRYQYSVNNYIDFIDNKKQLIEQKTMLESITKEQGELEEEYQNCLFYLKSMLEDRESLLDEEYNELMFKKENIEKEISEKGLSLSEIDKERDRVIKNIAVLEDNIEKTKKEIKQLTQYFWSKDTAIVFEPEESLRKMKEYGETLIKERDLALEEKTKLQNALEDNKIRESNIRESLAGLRVKAKGVENDIQSYKDRLNQLTNQALVYEVEGNIYSDSFSDKLKSKMNTTSNSLTREINRFHDMQKKKLLLEDCDYYIPDYEIKKIYEFFMENDVNCLPGTLWLKHQYEEKRAELIRLNPLIQYSIVIEESEMDRVKALSEKISELVEEYPVVLIVNSSRGIRMDRTRFFYNESNSDNLTNDDMDRNGIYGATNADVATADTDTYIANDSCTEGFDPVGLMDIYVIRAANTSLAIDQEAFTEYVEKIDSTLQEISSKIEQYKEDENRINKLINRIEEFTTQFPESYIKELSENLKQMNFEIDKFNEDLLKLAGQKSGIENNIKTVEKNIEENDKRSEENRCDIERLTNFIELNSHDKEYKSNLENLKKQEKMIDNRKSELEKKLEILRTQFAEIKEQCRINRDNIGQNLTRINEIKVLLRIEKASMKIEGTSDDVEARLKGLEHKISSDQIEFIIANINSIEKNIKTSINSIRKYGFEESDMERITERILDEEIQENERRLKELDREISALGKEERNLTSKKDKLTGTVQNMEKNIDNMYGRPPYEFDEATIIDVEMYDKQIKDSKRKQKKDEEKLITLKDRKGSTREILASLNAVIASSSVGEEGRQKIDFKNNGNLEDGTSIWDIMKMSIEEIAVLKNSECKKYNLSVDALRASRDMVKEAYERLYSDREWEDNDAVKRILSDIMSENIYNYEYVKKMFDGIFLTVENMKKATQLQLDECLENKNEMVERSYRRAEAVYSELKMVDGFSKIRIRNVNVKTVEIQIPALHPETGKIMMSEYIDNCISEIESMKANKTYDPGKIDDEIGRMMSPVRLLDAVVDLNEIVIRVYKPESNIELSRYIPWETVINWSGGEKLAGFFAMFISIISYLRYKKTNWHGSSKVIWIDNPFGQANAGHLLNYIFDLAKATKTQMICLTGLQEVNIYAQFDVVYSLVHRMLMSNTSVIRSNLVKSNQGVETAFYKVEHEQMSFI